MKKFCLFLILSLFSCPVFAQNEGDGVLKSAVVKTPAPALTDSDHTAPQVSYPKFSHRFYLDLNFNDNYQTTDRRDEYKETKAKTRFYSKLNFTKNLSLNSYLKFETVDQDSESDRRSALSTGGGDRTFENMGIYFEELNLEYETDKYTLVAGKFNPDFGIGWRWDRGIWAYDLAENYKQVEKLGVAGIVKAGDTKKTGQYNFGLSFFTNDRKNFDNSIITKRDSEPKSSGLPGDTRALLSYVASLDIKFDFAYNEKLSYHFSYINLAVDERDSQVTPTKIDDQKGYAIGMNYVYPFTKNFSLDSLLEYADMWNIGGDSDISETYYTASFIGRFYKDWNLTLVNTGRTNIEQDANGFRETISEISAGYEFKNNLFFDKLLFQIGYKHERLDLKTSLETKNGYGALIRYYRTF